MRVGRTSIGSRIISMLLVICMVFGMVPLSAFAATDETTAASVAAIRAYAQSLLASNYAKAATATQEKSDAFSWDSEQKTDDWRYFNGVMLQALLMLGVDSDSDITNSTGNALEFAKDFMDANIKSDGTITHYIKNEVDSVPPALAIFDLLQTAELDEDTATAYEKAVNFVYKQLEAQTKYPACGGNLLHKQESDGDPTSSWDEYELGLDGIYMAQSFYVEYANALASGKISNTVNSKTAGQIYQEVYERLMWVADAMYDETTGLYHHGYGTGDGSKDGTGGNGVFWGRGIGWYAVGLVDCIELMPDATYKANLIKKLEKLFDGMLPYQDTENAVDAIKTDSTYTGMWYNIVNTAAAVVSGEKANRPETSVSGLMAYALLKAYNEGWLTDAKYLEAGLAAFNGIVEHKLDGNSIADVYQKSGVGTDQDYYCSNSYESNEAKGVGGVLMAAAEADKYLGTAETFVGVVSAPDMTLSVGETPDYSDVKITLLGSQGTIKNVAYGDTGVAIYEYATAAIGDTAGSVTAAVYYNDVPIDTFNITVVDTTSGETANGTATVAPDASVPGDGTKDAATGTVDVTTSGTGETTYVLETTEVTADKQYVIVYKASADATTGVALKNPDNNSTRVAPDELAVDIDGDEVKFTSGTSNEDIALCLWEFVTDGDGYNVTNTNRVLRNNGNILGYAGDEATVKVITGQTSGAWRLNLSGNYYVAFSSSNFVRQGSTTGGHNIYLYEVTPGEGSGEDITYTITLTADQTGALVNKNGTTTLSATLSAAETEDPTATVTPTGTKVWSSADSGIATVNPETGEVTGVEAGTTTITCTVSGATVSGSEESVDLVVEIPVTVVAATTYDVSLTVTPVNMVLDIGETASFTAEPAISGLTGYTANITCSTPNASVATLDGNQVTAVGEGTTSIVVTVESITNGTNTYEVTGASETIRITVNPAHEHSYTSEVTKEATCTATGTVTFTCSCGDTKTETIPAKGHTYANGECTVCGAEDPDYVPEETTKETTEAPTDEPTDETTTETTEPSGDGNTKTYVRYTGAIESGKAYLIVAADNSVILKNTTATGTKKAAEAYAVTISSNTITLDADVASLSEWTFTLDGAAAGTAYSNVSCDSYYISNGSYYIANTGTTGSVLYSTKTLAYVPGDCTSGDYEIILKCQTKARALTYTGSAWEYVEDTTREYFDLYVEQTNTCEHTNTETITGKAATCTETGLTDGTKCSDCGTIITAQQTIAALGHDWNDGVITTEPGCETTGVKTYTCQNDGSHTKTETVAATGHTAGEVVVENNVAATCTTGGSYDNVVYCSVCDAEISRTTVTVPATGHNWGDDNICDTCGATKPSYNVTVTVQPTTEGFMLDTSGSVDWDEGEYIIVIEDGGKYYAVPNVKQTRTEVSIVNGMVDITYADASSITWTFDDTTKYQIYCGTVYLRDNSDVNSGDSEDTIVGVSVSDKNTGKYLIEIASGEYLYWTGSKWNRGTTKNTVYLYKWTEGSGEGEPEITNYTASLTAEDVALAVDGTETRVPTLSVVDTEGNPASAAGTYTYAVTGTEGIVTVDPATGKITAVAAGTSQITATLATVSVGGNSGVISSAPTVTFNVTVSDVYSVTLENATILEGDTVTLNATVKKNGETVTEGFELVYSVDGEAINGNQYPTSNVDADTQKPISVSLKVGGEEVASANAELTVYNVTVEVQGNDSVYVGGSATYTAAVVPNGGTKAWSIVSGGEYAEIDPSTGVLTANAAGEVTIQVTVTNLGGSPQTFTATKTVAVEAVAVQSVALEPSSIDVDLNAEVVDTSAVKMVLTMNNGTTRTVENADLTFDAADLAAVNLAAEGTYYVTVTDASGNTAELAVVVAEPVASNVTVTTAASDGNTYKIDTDGVMDVGVAYILARTNNTNALGALTSASGQSMLPKYTLDEKGTDTEKTYTETTAYHYYINNDGRIYYLDSEGTAWYIHYTGSSNTSQIELTTTETDGSVFSFTKQSDYSTYITTTVGTTVRYLKIDSGGGRNNGQSSDNGITLYKLQSTGGDGETTEYLVKGSGQNLTVDTGKTVDPKMTLTGTDADGNTVTVTGTWTFTSGNTAIATVQDGKIKGVSAGTATITATLKTVSVGGNAGEITDEITATFDVTVSQAVVSPDEWIHNFTEDGTTDPDNFYTISGNLSTKNGTASYDGMTLTQCLKMESSTKITFEAPNDGTLTLVFETSDSVGHSVYLTDPDGKKTSYTVPSDGVLEIELAEGGEYILTKNSGSSYLFYMEYASALTDGVTVTAPGNMYIAAAGAPTAPTHQLVYTVRHGDADVTNAGGYSIAFESSDASTVSVNDTGLLTGLRNGSATVTVTVTMENGTIYATQVPVTVIAPTISVTESMELIYDYEAEKYGNISAVVTAGGSAVTKENYTLGYFSSDETVATVDSNGKVTAIGEGTAIIYSYVEIVNGHDINPVDAPSVENMPKIVDTTEVTVSGSEIVDAHLNSYDYIIQEGHSMDDLLFVLDYVAQITGGVAGEEGIHLTINYNTGEKIDVKATDLVYDASSGIATYTDTVNGGVLTVDLNNVNLNSSDIYTARVTYTKDGEELFMDTIWIHVVDYDPADYDGTVTAEDGAVHYVLHTGPFEKVDANFEYVIVDKESGVALKNPAVNAATSTGALSAAVTFGNGVLQGENGNNLYNGVAQDYLIIGENDAELSAWLLDTFVQGDGYVQLNASNNLRYIGPGNAANMLIHPNVAHIRLVTVDEDTGERQIILGYGDNGDAYYLAYEGGAWVATTTESSVYLYRKDVEVVTDYGVNFDLMDKSNSIILSDTTNTGDEEDMLIIPEGFSYEFVLPRVQYGYAQDLVASGDYTIVWSSSNESVARVDQNGAVTGVNSGTAVITATLYDVYGNEVVCNVHNTESISKQVTVNITSANYKYVLTPNRMEIGVGSTPNFAKIAVEQRYPNAQGAYDGTSEFDQSVPFDQLVFHLADAVGYANDGSLVINSDTNRITAGSRLQTIDSTGATVDMQGFDSSVIGVYEVPVTYLDDTFYLLIYIVEDPYAGLDNADAIPGFPDAGSVRMNKTAEGVLDFTETGVTMLELTAAGVSTRSSVDVVLIVDVSNSMGWDINKSSNSGDKNKVPSNIATDEDKLDLAMEAATDFANILLDPELDGDNTITFVTFAGNDTNHGGDSSLDSVRTPFVAQSDLDTVVGVFADTDFTAYNSDDNKYTLQIGGYTETIDGVTYGEPKVSGTNRGNTNYDYAFGKAIEAVGQIKSKYAAQHDGASYDASGRQIHVVFMTDGAPSHYNNKKGTGNAADQLWKDKSTNYTTLSDVTQASWLEFIENYNELATELYPMIDGAYTVGFDLKAGGFGDWSWTEPEMERVLQGLAKNTVVPVTMATNATELNNFYTSLARNLAYAGTNAQVTDVIGGNFSLFTGVNMYSESIVTSGIMSQSTYDAMASYNNGVGFPINVYSYTLVTANDIGKTMDVIDEHGNPTGNIPVAEEHVGLRVNIEPELLEQVTFVYDRDTGTLEAYSNLLEGNILSESDGNRYINASTFTYSATLDTMEVDGHTITHTADETIKWKIGNITDKEVSMQYYAYLDGSLDNPREAKSGVYATNEYAYAEYVDIYNKYVKRYYGVPQVAWGAGSVRVRFYLVNSQGQFVNRAGVAFTNPANRIFLDGTASFEAELNNEVSFSALDALAQAGLAGENILYDPTAAVTVINSTTMGNGDVVWSYDAALDILDEDTKAKISDLLMDNDTSGGYHTTVVIDIPVVMTDMGQSLRPMASTTVVVDYGKPMDINVISDEEKPLITTGYVDHRNPDDGTGEYKYMMELVGFAAYSASHDLRDYVHFSNITYTDEGTGVYTGKYGNFTITDKDGANTQIRYTPTSIMGGVETVFVAVKFVEYDLDTNEDTDQYYYMYKQLNILPATSVYYETDGNMDPAFNTTASGWVLATENGASYDGIQDVYTAGSEIYGFDSSYEDNIGFSNGSAFVATGAAADGNNQFPVYATFSFTGTGFDIISRTGADQGTIRVTYTSRDTGTSQSVSVINKGQLDLYQIPVVSIEGLAHGTYDVRIDVYPGISFGGNTILGDQFVLDAVRVYGTLVGDESIQSGDIVDGKYTVSSTAVSTIYNTDGELAPLYTEVRDLLITADKFSSDGETTGAIFMDDFTGDADVSNYNASGANNEVYLKPDQAVAFSVNVSDRFSSFDLGMKSVDGNAVTAKVTIVSGTDKLVKENLVINSSTALFYDLLAQTGFNGTGEVHVVIQNSGDSGILSLTDIKITGGVDPSFVVSSKTLAAANFAEDKGLDVTAVSAAASSVRLAQTVTLTVTTEANVTDLMITNGYGEEIWFSTGYTEADNTKVWTVAIRPTLLGEQTYTVYGFMTETVDGVETRYFGEEQTVSINVEL